MRRCAVTALTLAACLAAPAASIAATAPAPGASAALPQTPTAWSANATRGFAQNARSDRAALNAYASYLRALLANKPVARLAEHTYATYIAQTCKAALEPVAAMPSLPSGWSTALTNIGEEIDGDATIELTQTAAMPFAKLASTLTTLRWRGAGTAATVRRFAAAQTALINLQPSDLCGDALDVASNPSSQTITTPPATLQFLTGYEAAAATLNTRLSAFLKLLAEYETSADRPATTHINTLAKRVNTMSASTVTSGMSALELALGITTAPSGTHGHQGLS